MSLPAHNLNKLAFLAVVMGFALAPTFLRAADTLIGNTCLIPIIHTNFRFPPEGGKIIQIGDQMYFVQSYRPECGNAGSEGTLIKGSPQGTVGGTSTTTTPSTSTTTTQTSCYSQLN
jgi:hypothetical protein